MRLTTTLLFSFIFIIGYCQNLAQTIEGISIIGAKQVEDKVILLSLADKSTMRLSAISSKGKTEWEADISVTNLGGYNFNKTFILGDQESVFVVQELPKTTVLTQYSLSSGEKIGEERQKSFNSEDSKIWAVSNGKLINVKVQDHKLNTEPKFILPSKYKENKLRVHFEENGFAYVSSRVLEANHGLMHLYLAKVNLETGDTIQKEIDMELAYTSFTYHSGVDKSVYGVMPTPTGFCLVGKLDIAFKNKYPTGKVGDNFIGFWVAKFTHDFELEFFAEVPFQLLDHIVPADVINKPAVIDLKEDVNGGVFVNINELQGVIYGKKYFVYLENDGNIGLAKGGNDEYHFMGYGQLGLRNAGRKNRIRLMNDDWPHYATNPFVFLSPKEELYSYTMNKLFNLNNPNVAITSKALTYFQLGESTLYFDYIEKKKGTLKIWTE